MISKLVPDYIFDSVFGINTEFFKSQGIKCIIFDIDNTLVSHGIKEPDQKVKDYLQKLSDEGFYIAIASNNSHQRAGIFCESLGYYFTAKSRKPSRKAIKSIMNHFGVTADKVAVVGDQLLTDVFMAKRVHAKAYLVKPIDPYENWFFVLKRAIEKPILWWFRRNKTKNVVTK